MRSRQALLQQIGRLHGNGHVSRLLESSGNRANSLVQRRTLGAVGSDRLASISVSSMYFPTVQMEIVAESELAPEGERASRFEGFDDRLMAYAQAWRHRDRVCAVVQDQDGKYHTLKTDFPGRGDVNSLSIVPFQNNYQSLRWVNLPQVSNTGEAGAAVTSWSGRAERAHSWRQSWELRSVPSSFACPHDGQHSATLDQFRRCIETEYASLLAQTLDIGRGDVNIIGAGGPTNPGALVSFDLTLDEKAHGGITTLPTDRTSEVPESGITFGWRAFNSHSEIQLLGTAVHEATHFAHAEMAIDWLQRWRASSSRSEFPEWLRQQRDRRRLTREQYDLIIEETRSGESPATETLSHLEGFMATYHLMPMDETIHRWEQIDKGAEFWAHAGHEINDTSISRLRSYYQGLEANRQQDFAAHARMRLGSVVPHVYFWQRVVRDILGG
jgi:hypothetical protein